MSSAVRRIRCPPWTVCITGLPAPEEVREHSLEQGAKLTRRESDSRAEREVAAIPICSNPVGSHGDS
jgi:hypothetical protein